MGEAQTAAHVLMIRPVSFAPNDQTAHSNRFQQPAADAAAHLQSLARAEFEELVLALRSAGVGVSVFDDTPEPHTPDSIFPNNWVSFHEDGTVLLYPMLAPNRRLERRPELLDALRREGFRIERIIDLSHYEAHQCYLEGTGSLVLDRTRRIAYACLSPRTNPRVLAEFAQRLDYEIVAFDASDAEGIPVYHTNVLLSVGCRLAVVCAASVRADQRAGLLQSLQAGGRCILDLTEAQMQAFAGNVLELRTSAGQPVIVISERAHRALDARQRALLASRGGRILSVPIPTVERIGGGSVRCMLAEIHLPHAKVAVPADPPSEFTAG